jgi:hypothetical protein
MRAAALLCGAGPELSHYLRRAAWRLRGDRTHRRGHRFYGRLKSPSYLKTLHGAAERIRTSDPRITNALLYRLSYRGKPRFYRPFSRRGARTNRPLLRFCYALRN